MLRRVKGDGISVFERVGWTEYTGMSKGPEMGEAEEMKIMLISVCKKSISGLRKKFSEYCVFRPHSPPRFPIYRNSST